MLSLNKLEDRACSGNTMAEYGMVGGLLIFCLAGLMLLGPSINGLFGKVKNDMTLRSNQSDIVGATSAQLNEKTPQGNGSDLPSQYSIDENGNAVDASNGTLQVAGTNGERNYAQILRDKEGKVIPVESLTPEEQHIIKDLANSEHTVAQYEEALHRLSIYSGGDVEKFKNSTIMVNGYPMKAQELMAFMQFAGVMVDFQTGNVISNANIKQETADYVSGKSDQVTGQVNDVVKAGSDTINNHETPNKVNEVANSQETHQNASDTCAAGQYSDTGTACAGSAGSGSNGVW